MGIVGAGDVARWGRRGGWFAAGIRGKRFLEYKLHDLSPNMDFLR